MGRKYSTRKSRRVIKRSLRKANKRRTYKTRKYKTRKYKTRKYKTRKYKTRKNKYKGGEIDPKLSKPEFWKQSPTLIGEGNDGKVYKCTYIGLEELKPKYHTSGKEYAMKVITKKSHDGDEWKSIVENEYVCHNKVDQSPHIPTLYAMWGEPVDDPTEYKIVMELTDGVEIPNSYSDLDRNNFFLKNGVNETESKGIVKQLCETVKFCHDNQVKHNDIHSGNVLLSFKYFPHIYLLDFGKATTEPTATADDDIKSLGIFIMSLIMGGKLNNEDDEITLDRLYNQFIEYGSVPYKIFLNNRQWVWDAIQYCESSEKYTEYIALGEGNIIEGLEVRLKDLEKKSNNRLNKSQMEEVKVESQSINIYGSYLDRTSKPNLDITESCIDLVNKLLSRSSTLTMDEVLQHRWFTTD